MARILRPAKFSNVVGQDVAIRLITKAILNDLMPPVCTIYGPSGVGKTTIARIIAMWECCTQKQGAEPCGECQNCEAILQNKHPDVFELDGGTYTGVEAIKSMLENIEYSPLMAAKRIYILDECHMLSKHSMSSLLKKFEEPLTNVQFILATTNIEKIPATILSRSFRLELNSIPNVALKAYLKQLAEENNYTIDDDSLEYITYSAQGSMRQAISIFEQLSIFSEGNITAEDTRKMLNLVKFELINKVISNLEEGDIEKLFQNLENEADFQLIRQVISEIQNRIKQNTASKRLIAVGYDLAQSSLILHKSPYSESMVEICLGHAALVRVEGS